VTWLAPLLIGVSALAVRFRRSRGTERAQLKWVLYAAVILASAQISGLWLPDAVVEVVWVLGAVALAGAILVALTRYRLYDIDLLINRTTVYAGVTLVSLAAYLTIVAAVTSVVPAARAGGSLLATAAVALGFAPLRSRLQRLVDRRMYGDRGDPYAALTRLATTHETATTTDVLPALAETVADSLRLSWVRITADAGGRTLVAEHGTRRPLDRFRTLPLTYRGTPVGELAYEARGWSPLSGEDEQLLRDVARNAGIAVHAAAVTAELQQSREALVTAREEERRRLRRDLHDGLGPSLASLTLQLDVAQRLVTTQPQRAESILGTLAQSSRQLVDDVRRLVHALRPPALDELGLEGALRQLITGAEGGETQVELQVDGLPQSLPAAVEVAVLRIVSEALTNVLRHASATRCLINVRAHDGAVVVEVRDDGVGVPTRWSPGVGLASMRERADELGGRFQVMSEAGEGTTITVVLPWDAEGLAGRGEDQHAEVG
jgi:signal transduction histidine kinase